MSITKVKTNNHEEWLELRSKYIGGSDAAAVVGMNPFSSPYALWAEKTGKKAGFSGNLATEVGTYLEEFIAQKFAATAGKKVRNCNQSILNSDYPFAIANIDREVVGEDAGLECKSTSELNASRFKDSDLPTNYYCQCVHYLAVTKKKRWYVAVLIGNRDFKIYMLTRIADDPCPGWCEASFFIDDAEIAALMNAEADFWESVKDDTPPAIDGSKATTEALKEVFPTSIDEESDLSSFANDLGRYMSLGRTIKQLEKEQDEVANKIKLHMGEASTGEVGLFKVNYKAMNRTTFDHKAFASEHPEMDLSLYYKHSSYRTFKVTERKK